MELTTPDLSQAKQFYGELCGWSFSDMDMGAAGTYSVFRPATGPGGGMFTMPGAPTAWLPYLSVDDIHTGTQKAVSLGATLVRGPQEVPEHGWFSILSDPTGAMIALWQGKPGAPA